MQSNPNYGRSVKFKVYEQIQPSTNTVAGYIPPIRDWVFYEGIFHEYGVTGEDNASNSIAIVELADGRIMAPFVEHIQFTDRDVDTHPKDTNGH